MYALLLTCMSFWQQSPITDTTGLQYEWIYQNDLRLTEICQYLRDYFGSPPMKPIFDIPVSHLLGPTDHLLVARELHEGSIVGTIRYHDLGCTPCAMKKEHIFAVDCFCIHPAWRKKNVGRQLLYKLNMYANARNIHYAVFLKEGPALSFAIAPLYTGMYVYSHTSNTRNTNITVISMHNVIKWLRIYHQFYPTVCIIHNPLSSNQHWFAYRKGLHSILIGVQDTYQRKDNKTMGWVTAWLESPCITDKEREEASDALLADITFDYIWMNQIWCGSSMRWQTDGAFHWYAYQWLSSYTMKSSYCLIH